MSWEVREGMYAFTAGGMLIRIQAVDWNGPIVGVMQEHGYSAVFEEAWEEMAERENVMSTGIGHGIAIPHARLAAASQLKLALVRYPSGIEFEALDGKPVYAAFGVVGPPEGTGQHVKLLARIARLVKETGALDEVLGAPDVSSVLAILARRDK